MLSEALKPVLEQLENQGGTLRQLQLAVTGFSRRFEDALQEEAQQADARLKSQEVLLRQQAEALVAQANANNKNPEQVHSTVSPEQMADNMAKAITQALAPLEGAISRLEVGMSSHQRQLEVTNRFQEMQHERDVKRFQAAKQKSSIDVAVRQLTRQLSAAPSSGKTQLSGEAAPRRQRAMNAQSRGSREDLDSDVQGPPMVSEPEDDQQNGRDMQAQQTPGNETPPISSTPFPSATPQPSAAPTPFPGTTPQPSATPTPFPQQNIAKTESSQSLRRGSSQSFTTETSALFLPDVLERERPVLPQPVVAPPRTPPRDDGNRRSSILGIPLEEVHLICHHANLPINLHKKCLDAALHVLAWWLEVKEPPRRGEVARFIDGNSFKALCGLVIFFNALFIVYTTDQSMHAASTSQGADNNLAVEIINICFLSFYTLELALKMGVHRWYFFVGAELSWNIFDLSLVLLSIYSQFFAFLLAGGGGQSANASALRALRVVRLARVLRVLQLMRVFNELRMLLHAVLGSAITLFWSGLILASIYYFFAVAFVQLLTAFLNDQGTATSEELRRDIKASFGDTGTAMFTLFQSTFGGSDWGVVYEMLVQTDITTCVFFVFFIAFMRISVMNILTAVFVEQTIRLAQPDLQVRAKLARQKEKSESRELKKVLSQLDQANSGTISVVEFQYLLENTGIRHYLSALGLDIRNAEEVFSVLALTTDGESVDIDAFVAGCMSMRGLASSVGQANLVMETRMLRRSQREHCLILMEKLDAMAERIKKGKDEVARQQVRSQEVRSTVSNTPL